MVTPKPPVRQPPGPTLTIGDLAARTGVATATLRMWGSWHGFPVPDPPGERAPAVRRARRRAGPGRAAASRERHPARGRDRLGATAGGGRGRRPGRTLGVRDAATAAPAPAAPATAEVHPARAVLGDRGRVPGAGRPGPGVRRLPAGAVLPRDRGPVARARPGGPVDGGAGRPGRRAEPGARHHVRAPARGRTHAPGVGGGVRRGRPPGRAHRLGAARTVHRPPTGTGCSSRCGPSSPAPYATPLGRARR